MENTIEKFKRLKEKEFLTEAFLGFYFQIEALSRENLENSKKLEECKKMKLKIEKIFSKERKKILEWENTKTILKKVNFKKEIINVTKGSLKNLNTSEKIINSQDIKKMFEKYLNNGYEEEIKRIITSKNGSARKMRNTLVHKGTKINLANFERFEEDMLLILKKLYEVRKIIKDSWES